MRLPQIGRIPGRDGGFSWEKTDKAEALAKAAGISKKQAENERQTAFRMSISCKLRAINSERPIF